jgi:prepilin-type N-terminal cleavage/methylation domain-containing protein
MKNISKRFKNQRGFNLIELMIVIAIIALLIAVGIPAYQAMVRNGNEVAAIQSIQTIKTLQVGYAGKHQGKFAPTFDELRKSADLDEKFTGDAPVVSGYVFKMTTTESSGTTPSKYTINADPQTGQGNRHFYFDSTLGATKQTEEDRAATDKDQSI